MQRLRAELPGGIALFGKDGVLLEANEAFHQMVGVASKRDFAVLFGAEPATFAPGAGEAVELGTRHWAVLAKPVPGWGWLCQLQDVSAWVKGRAEAAEAATRDGLTGLANRSLIMPEVARALADPSRPAALLAIDLDRFKAVNDTLGHAVGDALLRKVGQRLSSSLRPHDVAARLGGDEFAVLQLGAPQPAGAEGLAKRLVEVLSRPYVVDGHMVDVGASVGVAVPGGEADPAELFKPADIALYRAKQAKRGRYTFFEPSMDEGMQARRALKIDLRRALAFRQFELHYQPQLDLKTQRLTGMEALIHWRHPERGMVPTNKFISIAEENGLIVPIGEWVIRQACEDAVDWPKDIAVAVNVSAKQLGSSKLVGTIAQALAASGIEPARFEVDITESVLMADTEQCVHTLHALRRHGVRVSMGDFATGYLSLSYLRSFPFDMIKIDQSFIRSEDPAKSDGIIRAIVAIGEHLGMSTICEGVGTEAQLGQVETSGCGLVQGYLVSRPVPASEIAPLLAKWRGPADTAPTLASPARAVAPARRRSSATCTGSSSTAPTRSSGSTRRCAGRSTLSSRPPSATTRR